MARQQRARVLPARRALQPALEEVAVDRHRRRGERGEHEAEAAALGPVDQQERERAEHRDRGEPAPHPLPGLARADGERELPSPEAPAREVGADVHQPHDRERVEQEPRGGVRGVAPEVLDREHRHGDRERADGEPPEAGAHHRALHGMEVQERRHARPEQEPREQRPAQEPGVRRHVQHGQRDEPDGARVGRLPVLVRHAREPAPLPGRRRGDEREAQREQRVGGEEEIEPEEHEQHGRGGDALGEHPLGSPGLVRAWGGAFSRHRRRRAARRCARSGAGARRRTRARGRAPRRRSRATGRR